MAVAMFDSEKYGSYLRNVLQNFDSFCLKTESENQPSSSVNETKSTLAHVRNNLIFYI